ncbi:MAG: hypothetical protein ACXV2C_03905 [Candidatus Bathyarchaeia archaeon]
MTPEEVYQDYVALKAHFSSKYNYQMYEGKIKTSTKSVGFQRDKTFFQKISKHKDPHTLLLANIAVNKKAYVRTIAYSSDAEQLYAEHTRKMQALFYIFKRDLTQLTDSFDNNLKVIDCNHPKIVVLYLGNEITLETLCIITSITNCIDHWEKKLPDDPVMSDLTFQIRKYLPFIKFDTGKYKKAIVSEFTDRVC